MSITKRTELMEQIAPNQVIELRTTTIVEENGVEIARNYHRLRLPPGSDVSDQPQEVQDIASVLWTDEVIATYAATGNEVVE